MAPPPGGASISTAGPRPSLRFQAGWPGLASPAEELERTIGATTIATFSPRRSI